jgi:hypothetical protein
LSSLSASSFNLKSLSLSKDAPQLGSANIQSGLQGFGNRTGASFGAAQLSSLINFINSASTFYRDNVEQNLRYIQNQMTTAYGGSSNLYGVILQSNSTYTYTNLAVYTANAGENYATLAPGVNNIYPKWSYLVYSIYVQSYLTFDYISYWSQGSGVSASTGDVIKNVIYKYDGTSTCTCGNTYSIATALNSYDGQSWNVVCQSYSASY